MREKFELLIQINSFIEKGEIPNLDDIFHTDYLYLKDNTLVNRDEHLEFMRKEFTRKRNEPECLIKFFRCPQQNKFGLQTNFRIQKFGLNNQKILVV